MPPIVYLCGIHKKKFLLEQGKSLLYYMCPNHKVAYRGETDSICNNFVSRNVVNIINNDIEALYAAGHLETGYKNTVLVKRWNSQYPLSHAKNKPVTVYYEVTDINEDFIQVEIKNERIMKK